MHPTMTRPADRYSPLYFLVSLGAGGLAVTFFMYLMFWVPHPTRPVPVFEDVAAAFAALLTANLAPRPTCVLLSGGNVSLEELARIL